MNLTFRMARVHDHDIVESPESSRYGAEPESGIDELASDIEANGQLVPVLVVHDRAGRLVLVDGRRRLKAIRKINDKRRRWGYPEILVRCEIIENLPDPTVASVAANWERKQLDPLDLAASITDMRSRGYDTHQIARIYHRSEAWVYNTESISELPDDVKQKIRETGMSWRSAVALAARYRNQRRRRKAKVTDGNAPAGRRIRYLASRLREISYSMDAGDLIRVVAGYIEGRITRRELCRSVKMWVRGTKLD